MIPEFINRFKYLKGKRFVIQGTGNEIRSFIFIDDFVRAFDLLMKKGRHLNIYNLGTSEKIKLKNWLLKCQKFLRKRYF